MIGRFYMMKKATLFLCVATPTAIIVKDPGPKVTHAAKRTVAKAKHWTNTAAKRLHRAPVFAEAIAEPKVAADRIDTVIVPAICPPTDGLLTDGGGGGGGIGSSGGWWGGGIGGGGNITPGDGGLPFHPANPGVPTTPGPVPEPGTYLIMGLGLGIVGIRMRRARATERKAHG